MTDATITATQGNQAPHSFNLGRYRSLIGRLPVTMRPSLNQQLEQWEMLFPFEQGELTAFLRGLESFELPSLGALTRPLCLLEAKMGVEHWDFSQSHETMENASLLARSEYFSQWRKEVQQVFEEVNTAGRKQSHLEPNPSRLILLIFPESLPVDPLTAWKRWGERGRAFRIAGHAPRLCELVLKGRPGQPGIASLLGSLGSTEASDLWLVDAEAKLGSMISASAAACSLSYSILKPFRDNFLAAVNTVPKKLEAADQILSTLRHQDWSRFWPPDFVGQARLRSFVIDLFLSGNGALIFSNAFVEWAASEALRRARPRVIVARFGMRSKPKPFSSIAIFENQQQISTLPDVDDPENSAVDAAILACYVWLAATRYPEYEQTCTLCISENANAAYVTAPEGKWPEWGHELPVSVEEIHQWIAERLSS
jgi:hypothetical protein